MGIRRGRETADQHAARLEVRHDLRDQLFRLEQVLQHMQQDHRVVLFALVQPEFDALQVDFVEMVVADAFQNVLADQCIHRVPVRQRHFLSAMLRGRMHEAEHLPGIHTDFAHVQRASARRVFAQEVIHEPVAHQAHRIVGVFHFGRDAVIFILQRRIVFQEPDVPTQLRHCHAFTPKQPPIRQPGMNPKFS